ncbi:beta-1,3-galactosyl-O-glycosyl-glycoprotein beta-1,6-N-acetylglucosaminyltransferase-like [Mercenaria mercenaria]|uniref:beta-1,3-galactosyl-O-glycosyl-glycoprotein beta-1,6-N-acetylglucosaminyltransferase-like n=1 Tax=Mercenaria mercenaria TaxID=6596 RepID=UPI00234E5CD4|nr:beta-1,3-galactosyl-O-glycosyl-glycoprotein beta-1,6-N-acetylglucosaminyltransferase-like [Mercenaria mercenaria]XP_045192809.2 beta-1,3-galactosyl-O-glycosyl-glycoprotein beta-1,6-N-acetylglucosaminyltransferase-like [Mercenaria mercenaria]
MAKTVLKFRGIGAVLTVCGILLFLVQYTKIIQQVIHTGRQDIPETAAETNTHATAVKTDEVDKALFHENELNLANEVGQSKAFFNGSEQSEIKSVHKQRLSNLTTQTKHFIVSDEKFKKSYLENDNLFKVPSYVKEVNCNAIVKGDENKTKKAEHLSEANPKVGVTAQQYIHMTSDCSKFVSDRRYITDTLTEVENDFHIAFSLLIFKDIEQSERLLRAIYRPQNNYCIHIDKKSADSIYDAMSSIANCFDNVFIASTRYKVQWGTMTVLEPDLLCMKELWDKSKSWKYFINLTGQEFPLRTNYELVQILKAYNGANDIEGTIKRANRGRWKSAGTPPHGIVPTKGSVHIVASREYVDYVLHNQKAQDFLNWTKHTKVPDETFFSSLNHNPGLGVPGAYKGHPDTDIKGNAKPFVARFKNWGDWPCNGKRVRMVCVFGTGDLPMLASRRELFANKFYLDYHHFALDCMEELYFNHTRDEHLGKFSFDPRWYSDLEFILNKV